MNRSFLSIVALSTLIPSISFGSCELDYTTRILELQKATKITPTDTVATAVGLGIVSLTSGNVGAAISGGLTTVDFIDNRIELDELLNARATLSQLQSGTGIKLSKLTERVEEIRGLATSEEEVIAIGLTLDQVQAFCIGNNFANDEEIAQIIGHSFL